MSRMNLREEIRQVFLEEKKNGEANAGNDSSTDPNEQINRMADGLARAIDRHVEEEMTRLWVSLTFPGAYTGVDEDGKPITVNPNIILTYRPHIDSETLPATVQNPSILANFKPRLG